MKIAIAHLNSSLDDRLLIPPQLVLVKKSTGDVTWGIIGNLNRRSNSAADISLLTKSIWNVICDVNISLSHSNSPLVVYMNTEYVIHSIRFITLLVTSGAGSALRIAFWKTTLNAFREN